MKKINFPRIFKIAHGDSYGAIPFLNKVLRERDDMIIYAGGLYDISEESFMVLRAQLEKRLLERAKSHRPVMILGYGSKTVFNFFNRYSKIGKQGDKYEFHVNEATNKGYVINAKVDTNIIDKVIVNSLKKIHINEYYDPLYDFLVELIGNATEHGLKRSKINWWLKWYRNGNSICFVFVDMGMGVVKSYKKASVSIKYYLLPDKYVVRDSLDGFLGSSTKEDNRGRGMPMIKKMVQKKWISNFLMVTNKVSVSFNGEKFVYLRNPDFIGTYFYWTIDIENFEIWKKLR